MKKVVVSVLGTRPEIIKLSPLLPLLDRDFRHILIHTGQHFDENMDRLFFRELKLRAPRHFLNTAHSGFGPVAQIGLMLERLEPLLIKLKPQAMIVQGDTNSTLAGAIAAARRCVPVFHVEAGCRSFNREMPEEQNRVMVDHISDLLFAPDDVAVRHLRNEGINTGIYSVGNSGLDAARRTMNLTSPSRLARFGCRPDSYVLATIHRAENTDNAERLESLISALNDISTRIPVLFPIHPRTAIALKRENIRLFPGVLPLEPLGNVDLITLLRNCVFSMSDSGGIQEEAAVVNKPCLILRDETEWTRLVDAGKNFLAGTDSKQIVRLARKLLDSDSLRKEISKRRAPLRFGASERIMRIVRKRLDVD